MSTGDEASTFARFHFRRHFLQHSGFRMVKSDSAAPAAYLNEAGEKVDADGEPLSKTEQTITEGERKESNVYETQSLVDQYLGLHYSSCSGKKENIPFMMAHEGLPAGTGRFPQRVAELLFQLDGSAEAENKWTMAHKKKVRARRYSSYNERMCVIRSVVSHVYALDDCSR